MNIDDALSALRGKKCTRRQREDAAQALRQLHDQKQILEIELRSAREVIANQKSEMLRVAEHADAYATRVADAVRILSAPMPRPGSQPPIMPGQPARLHGLGIH